uniref:Uncharacterized protein n=1 Tax=Rhizophora mucronata TaxID=61149 RepID=A0A2P2QXA6_RHIMU
MFVEHLNDQYLHGSMTSDPSTSGPRNNRSHRFQNASSHHYGT